jgi:PAS domain S-box-containing protein
MFLAAAMAERRRAFAALYGSEQAVRQQYAELATIYHAAPVGLAFVDTQLRYVGINDCLAEINGAPAEAHLGRTIRAVLPHRADTIEPIYRRVLTTGESVVDVKVQGTTAARPESVRTWLVSRYPVKDARGALLGVSTVVQETTERKQIEEARQELAHASCLAILGEMTASIAHEINQPLGAILSNADAAEMLLESAPESLAEVRHILDDIRKDDLRASEVIRRLRALIRKREMEIQPVNLNDVIAEVLGLIRAESGRRAVVVETELATDVPLIRGDKVHVKQVLLNLLLNGMDAMADMTDARKLTVRTVLDEDGFVAVPVSDAGSGIAPDRLPRLFDPFFSTKKEGVGLGLPIARSLVKAPGGRIWAENNPGGGATFRLTLPAAAQMSGKDTSATQRAPLELIT